MTQTDVYQSATATAALPMASEDSPPPHYRSIWARVSIAELPYPVIAADDVVLSLYGNRLLMRVSSTSFTITVFFRDVSRVAFFSEDNALELQVPVEGGGVRAYLLTCAAPGAALMLYDVMLPFLPSSVSDSPLGRAAPSLHTTDYPFSLLSAQMMAEAGFYELFPRRPSPAGADPTRTSRLYFPPSALSAPKPLSPSVPSSRRTRRHPSVPPEEAEAEETAETEPRLITYAVLTGEAIPDVTPLSIAPITPPSRRPSQSLQRPSGSLRLPQDSRSPSMHSHWSTGGTVRVPRRSASGVSANEHMYNLPADDGQTEGF